MKQFFSLLLVCLVLFSNKVQAEDYKSLFEQNIQLVYGSSKASFKGQALKGKRNGMGILPIKTGTFYFGDFSQNDISGLGMMISLKQNINNCSGCFVYAGNWKSNKKNGYGRCYDINGKLIYEGQFENDKPSGVYPSDFSNENSFFRIMTLESGNIFMGEFINGLPNGMASLIFQSGDVLIASFKDGKQKGIGLFLHQDGKWETMNFKDGNYAVVSSSDNYKNIDEERKSIQKGIWNNALNELSDLATSTISSVGDIISIKNSSSSNNGNVDKSPSDNSVSSKKRGGKKWVSCDTCKGTGVCRNCGGTGKYSYTKDGKCHECRPVGSGKCGTCKGKKGSYV